MKKSDITYIVFSAFAAMTAFLYCCTMWFSIKLPRYYPLEHTWKWVKEEGVPSQGWYGMQAFAYLAAAMVALVIYFLLKRTALKEVKLTPTVNKWLGLVVTVIIMVCMGCMLYYEFEKCGIF